MDLIIIILVEEPAHYVDLLLNLSILWTSSLLSSLGEPVHCVGLVSLTQHIVESVHFMVLIIVILLDESVHYVGLVFLIQCIVELVHFMDLVIIIPLDEPVLLGV